MAVDESQRKSKLTAILVVVLIAVALILFIVFYNISTPSHHRKSTVYSNDAVIHGVCTATRDPSACKASLKSEWRAGATPGPATALQAINVTLRVSTRHLHAAIDTVGKILDGSSDNQNRSDTSRLCLEVLRYSDERAAMAADALPGGRIKDARAWMSAALAYHYGCMSGLKNVNDTPLVAAAVEFFNTTLINSTVDVLDMMANYDYFGEEIGSWGPPQTERDGFWPTPGHAASSGNAALGGVPAGMAPNVTVCGGGGGCDYETVQEAVAAAPDNSSARFVIWIKAGVYNETVRVAFEKKNVVLLGDGMGKTVITGNLNVGLPRVSTYNSATLGVLGDGFMASNLTIENTAGVDAHQAVAFRSDSDLSIIENCEFIGNQDTLYAHSLRQYYKSCRIQGNIDFIFGQSAAVFEDCTILIGPHQNEPEKGDNNAVTAHGRIDPAQSTGFVFRDCVINGTDEYMALYSSKPAVHKTYLGRPWKEYSRTVFLHCTFESLISAEGWMPWNADFALKTLYYAEFQNKGPGSDTSKRVNWSSLVPAQHVDFYTVQNFIQGDQWIPAPHS
ncbi:probable pectinesterase/pectinesterase inhibitor 51 [Salvia miltiorrhiza]|uniref:probable pectinesterase/pectinesterase inhibitor 51 n=1 Tax=Salvia miltiorrhiza TaxID=226208 RepID=UPI0025AD12CD|nr:probable pectinesterase/pectinesterase inhibitor 51 [Salvia miltiorrhiza]